MQSGGIDNIMDTKIYEGHREHMRQRFITHLGNDYQDHELLELLLYYAIPRRNTNEIAHHLLREFSSLRGVIDAPYEILSGKEMGIGPSAAILLKLAGVIMYRCSVPAKQGTRLRICQPEDAIPYLQRLFYAQTEEMCYMLMLDNMGRIIACSQVSKGSASSMIIHVQGCVRQAVTHYAASVLIAHNHPHGTAAPSQNDMITTRMLKQAFDSVGIQMLEHVILADDAYSLLMQRFPF